MPALSPSEEIAVRSDTYASKKYLSIVPQTVLFEAVVVTATADLNLGSYYAIEFSTPTGTASACKVGMTVWVGSTPQSYDIARTTLRRGVDLANPFVYIEDVPYGDMVIAPGHYITIIEEFIPSLTRIRLVSTNTNGSRVPNDFIEYHKYDEAYSQQNKFIEPCISVYENPVFTPPLRGTPFKYAGWVDAGQTYRTVDITPLTSNLGEGTVTSLTINYKDGTFVSNPAPGVYRATFPVGFRFIEITASVNSGAAVHTLYVPIWVHDNAYPPVGEGELGFKINSDETTDGRDITVSLYGGAIDESVIGRGAMVCYWKDVNYGTSITPPAFVRKQFVGWVAEETAILSRDTEVSFSVRGIMSWLKEIQNGSVFISDTGAEPKFWYNMRDITVNKFVHYILREYTTALLICGFEPDTATLLPKPKEETASRNSIFQQCLEVCIANEGRFFAADSCNTMYIQKSIHYLPFGEYGFTDERASISNITELNDDDWFLDGAPQLTRSLSKKIGKTDATGAWWFTPLPEPRIVASRAPSKTAGASTGTDDLPFQRIYVPSSNYAYGQDRLNMLTGLHYARKNSEWQSVSVTLPGTFDIFEPAHGETISIDYTSDNPRELTIVPPLNRFVITSVSINHGTFEDGYEKVVLNLERVVEGAPGVTVLLPKREQADDPFWDYFWEVSPAIPDFTRRPPIEEEDDVLIGFALAIDKGVNKVARTFDFSNGEPEWENVTPSGMLGTVYGGAAYLNGDQLNFKIVTVDGSMNGRIYHTNDAFAETISWALENTFTVSGTNFITARIEASPDNYFWAVGWMCEDGFRVRRSGVYGTWTATTAVGDNSAIDTTVAGYDFGMAIENSNLLMAAKDALNNYTIGFASGPSGSFTYYTFTATKPVCTIRLVGDLETGYVAVYNNANLTSTPRTNLDFPSYYDTFQNSFKFDTGVETTDTLGGSGTIWDIESYSKTSFSTKGRTTFVENIPLLTNLSLTAPYSLKAFRTVGSPPPSEGTSTSFYKLTYKATLYTEDKGSIVAEGTIHYKGIQWTSGGIVPGPFEVFNASAVDTEITGNIMTWEDLFNPLDPTSIDFKPLYIDYEITWSDFGYPHFLSLKDETLSAGVVTFEYNEYSSAVSSLWRLNNYTSTPSFTDITPDDMYIPYNKNGLSAKSDGTLWYAGKRRVSGSDYYILRQLTNNGVDKGLTRYVQGDERMVYTAKNIIVASSPSVPYLSYRGQALKDKEGNYRDVFIFTGLDVRDIKDLVVLL